jgi:circadian clock protein KaiC
MSGTRPLAGAVIVNKSRRKERLMPLALRKSPTGIKGLDEVSLGGLPQGRPTIVCGGPGCGKTMLAVEFLVRGALQYGEPGVFMTFEETPDELAINVASLGFDLKRLIAKKKLFIDYVRVERSEIQETGEYDLEGLFIRLQSAIELVGAKRVVLDTLEALFAGFSNMGVLRAEIRRLFRWLKDRGMTTIVTAERGEGTLTRHGLEEYVSDCVILMDHRVIDQVSTRRLRIVKYRGTAHGANEYPFLIDEEGLSVLPITSLSLDHEAPTERLTTGIADLDAMLGGNGVYRGSTVLVSGTAGTGKTTIAAHFADSFCKQGKRCLYLAFEESQNQLIRNMRSVGIDLEPWTRQGLLQLHASRPTRFGLEMHLVRIHKLVEQFKPLLVVVDPITNLVLAGSARDIQAMLTRLIDFLKAGCITAIFTSLTAGANSASLEQSEVGVSSLIDTWILLRDLEVDGERNRGLHIIKSRGMAHSNRVREFVLTRNGIRLLPVYLGAGGVLTGSARVVQEARERDAASARQQETARLGFDLERKRKAMEAQIEAARAEFAAEANEIERKIEHEKLREARFTEDRSVMARRRQESSDGAATSAGNKKWLRQGNKTATVSASQGVQRK